VNLFFKQSISSEIVALPLNLKTNYFMNLLESSKLFRLVTLK